MKKEKQQYLRKFLGKTENFESKEERNFEKKHLKAYLKGWDLFRFGFTKNSTTGELKPNWFKTNYSLTKV